jgi:anthranilate/para-aminobenzoate synthase component I
MVEGCRWWRYPAVVVVDRDVRVVGEDLSSVARLSAILAEKPRAKVARISSVVAADSDAEHCHRVACVLGAIARGEVYQVNLARRFRLEAEGSALALLSLLSQRCRAPFGFGLSMDDGTRIAGISPELCLSLSAEGWLLTRPIKGTCPRGSSQLEDLALGRALSADPKERAELAMVVDLERNDLSRIAEVGTVRVLSPATLETFDSVHHRTASVVGRLRAGVSRSELLRVFLPSGSVTGTPKIAAMRMIAQLESARRGIYCGAYGYLSHDGSLRLGMAIRTLVADGSGQGEYFSGGGIVADSVAEREVAETGWKSRVIVEPGNLSSQPDSARPPGWSFQESAENWAGWPDSGSERKSTHGS